ncbi:tRNA(fMet)-specific endonuclease VapC [Desulfamplus magnetovallimortis]|uniref:Ribonuclease VapC n=1 Tax=Desulfamplus magnetovallimortis TaxID=1246637 RepID=A0A1W1HGZ9_9BACT|nr:type II toxin-antitoxin system VapC family toxin [Desulfamplus magnetovallimortis]SLM31658.1 tRNA(fMet)-specific endonuclease VapC [Desulfamplus magnetovallimortis]
MKYLLDTNTCIKYLNGTSESVRNQIEQMLPENIVVCSVVKAELFYGAMKSKYPERNISKQKEFLDHFISYSFDDNAAEKYGNIRAQLEKNGTPIGPNDLMISAIALSQNLILITHNVREFERVEGLVLEDWE